MSSDTDGEDAYSGCDSDDEDRYYHCEEAFDDDPAPAPAPKPTRKRRKREEVRKEPLIPKRWTAIKDSLTPREFKQAFRMTQTVFLMLFARLLPHLPVVNQMRSNHGRGLSGDAEPIIIDQQIMLCFTLSYLGGARLIDLRMIYDIPEDTLRPYIWAVCDAILTALPFSFPKDRDTWAEMSAQWQGKSANHVWEGQIGAIDGCCFAQKNPGRKVTNPKDHRCERKDKYALLCIAICDSMCRFLHADFSFTASTHDSSAWDNSDLGQWFAANGPDMWPFFLNGDDAFNPTNWMTTPSKDDDYNYVQSSNRVAIERAFGILIARWGILWRKLEMAVARRSAVVGVCMRLHNFLISHDPSNGSEILSEYKVDTNGRLLVPLGSSLPPPPVDANGNPVYVSRQGQRPQRQDPARFGPQTRIGVLQAAVRDAAIRRHAA